MFNVFILWINYMCTVEDKINAWVVAFKASMWKKAFLYVQMFYTCFLWIMRIPSFSFFLAAEYESVYWERFTSSVVSVSQLCFTCLLGDDKLRSWIGHTVYASASLVAVLQQSRAWYSSHRVFNDGCASCVQAWFFRIFWLLTLRVAAGVVFIYGP